MSAASRSQQQQQAPAIRPTQFENGDIGSLKNSVNLFRGDVNWQQTLVTLPGKLDDETLQVTVNVVYQSNVSQQVGKWNLDAPTGVLGLGWSIDGERISAQSNGSLSSASLQYAYESGGSGNPLYGTNAKWVRGAIDASLASILDAGSGATAQQIQQLGEAFAATGLTLGANLSITAEGSGGWRIDDAGNEHLWALSLVGADGGQAIEIADGGQGFELQSFQFWKIYYYPAYERWEITDTSGAVKVFGGGIATNDSGFAASSGGSVEWGVKWDADGSWTGSSAVAENQFQYATAWNLYAKKDRYGAQVTYRYNEFPANADGTISKGAEQLVTAGGKPFTKACYLTSITDFANHKIVFDYGEYKTFTETVQEYLDPHAVLTPAGAAGTLPANFGEPNGFQDKYEVLLLTKIEVQTPQIGDASQYGTIFGFKFAFTDPQNVSTTPVAQQAVTCKRYLQSITWFNAAGQALPGYDFTYCLDGDAETGNLGALKTMTYPEGSVGTFTYAVKDLAICHRRRVVEPPAAMNSPEAKMKAKMEAEAEADFPPEFIAFPRVWFGENYAVTAWISQDTTKVSLEVFTWDGRWVSWTPADPIIYDANGENGLGYVAADSLQVVMTATSFALSFQTDQQTLLYLFRQDPRFTSRWRELVYQGANYLTFTGADSVSFAAGNSFFLATVISGGGNPVFSLYRYTYDWRDDQPWSGMDAPLDGFSEISTPLYALAQAEYYLTLKYEAGGGESTLNINYLDQFGSWQAGGETYPDLDLSWNNTSQNGTPLMSWANGASLVAYTQAEQQWSEYGANYSLGVLRWDANYQFCHAQTFSDLNFTPVNMLQELPSWSPAPRIVGNAIVACHSTVCRFTGGGWDSYTFPASDLYGSGGWAAYAYGQDFTLQVYNDTRSVTTWFAAYDPQTGFPAGAPQTASFPGAVYQDTGFPSASGEDYFCALGGVFYRGFSPAWANALADPVYSLPTEDGAGNVIDSFSIINEAPNFMAYLVPGAQPQDSLVQLLILENGGVTATTGNVLEAETYFTSAASQTGDASPDGQYPAGRNILATFPARSGQFQQTPFYSLHSYAGNKLRGAVRSYPVESLEVTVWEGESRLTCYEYDAMTAACDPSGEVVKYYQSAMYDGCASPSESCFGRTVNIYHNGLRENFAMLDGQPIQTACFAGEALFDTEWNANLGLDPNSSALNQKTPVPQALSSLFPSSSPLSSSATLEYVEIGCPEDARGSGDDDDLSEQQGYRYWIIEDAPNRSVYNIDYDGNPKSPQGVRVFTGRLVKYSSNRWRFFTHRNNDALRDAPVKLHGGYVLPVAQTTFTDGVPLVTYYDYLPRSLDSAGGKSTVTFPFSGNVQNQQWTNHNVRGEKEFFLQESIDAAQVYPPLAWANALTGTASVRTRLRGENGGSDDIWLTLNSSVNTWAQWQGSGGIAVCDTVAHYAWKGDASGADAGDFAFDAVEPPDASLWQIESATTARAGSGVVTESTDASGLVHSTILDSTGAAAILIASNASAAGGEVDFCGFEPDETGTGAWTLSGGAQITAGNSHTGEMSLYLPSNQAKAERAALTPVRNERVYFLSCWYQTGGAQRASGAGIEIRITQNGAQIGETLTVAFDGEPNAWQFAHATIDLAAYHQQAAGSDAPLSIGIAAVAGDASEIWIDDVCFAPRACTFAAAVHDYATGQTTAKLSQSGKTWRQIYDRNYKLTGGTSADERIHGLKLEYYSRSGNGGVFNSADPNATLKIKAGRGGSHQTFRNGDGWTHRWQPADQGSWTTQNGWLVHSDGKPADSLTSVVPIENEYALYFELEAENGAPLGGGFRVLIGSAAQIAWNGGEWQLTIGDQAPIASFNPSASSPASVLLALTGTQILFWASGQLLFSATIDADVVKGVPAIETGANGLALRSLTLLESPQIQWAQEDATKQNRLAHVLAGADYFVNQYVCDAVGNRSIKTKAVPGTFGASGDLPFLQYRPTLIDLQAFQTTINTTGAMNGDVADYYDGSNEGATDDDGYPYTRHRFEPSPLKRVVEIGSPGADCAIIENTEIGQRQTIRYFFSSNAEVALPENLTIPAGLYQVKTRLDQSNSALLTVKDVVSNTVAKISGGSGDETQWVINTTGASYDASGAQTKTLLPNSFRAGGAGEQAIIRNYNALGQVTGESYPDSGTTHYIYDPAGKVCFTQDADGAANNYAIYFLYDELGRQLSRGVLRLTGDGDEGADALEFLRRRAMSGNRVDESKDDVTVLNTWIYDGDGSDPNAFGNRIAAVTTNGGQAQVTERQSFDRRGNTIARRVETIWAGEETVEDFSTGYDYDNLGNLVRVGYPELNGVSLRDVFYRYNGLGQLTGIYDQSENRLAAYGYNAAGQADGISLGAQPVTGNLGYDSPGKLCSTGAAYGSGSFASTAGYNPDGSINNQIDNLAGAGAASGEFPLDFSYALQKQIGAATDTGGGDLTQIFGYLDTETNLPDLNGNIQSIDPAGDVFKYPFANQLDEIMWSGGAGGTTSFVYNDSGSVRTRSSTGASAAGIPDLTFDYLPGSTLPAQISVGGSGGTVKFAYDSDGNRVSKRVYNGAEMTSSAAYVAGPYSPLAEVDAAGNGTAYVYGVTMLSLMFRGDTVYTVATDRLGSVRMVFDASGNVAAAYNYLSFGALAAAQEPSAGWMSLLYTGMVFDAETGLYNLNARMYDPAIGRFYAPDAARQFPSPYIYTGNHPNLLTDPSGMITQSMENFVGATMAGVALIGFGIAFLLPPGADVAVAAGIYAVSGFVTSFGTSGLTYAVEHTPDTWSWGEFFGLAFVGGVTGAVGGAIAGGVSQAGILAGEKDSGIAADRALGRGAGVESGTDSVQIKSFSEDWKAMKSRAGQAMEREKTAAIFRVTGRAFGYSVSAIAYTSFSNVIYQNPWYQGLGFWTLFGLVEGAGMGVVSSLGSIAEDTLQISAKLQSGYQAISDRPEFAIYAIGLPAAYYTVATQTFAFANNLYNTVISEYGSSDSSGGGSSS